MRSPSGVLIADDFRDNLIIDRYDVAFLTMRGSKTRSIRSENSEDALTWNAFRSLAQVDPVFWFPRLTRHAFPELDLPTPADVGIRLWRRLSPPPGLRDAQGDEGYSEIDVLIETVDSVWCIEAKYRSDVSMITTNNATRNQILRNIDVGSWFAGPRNFFFSLLLVNESLSPRGAELIRTYQYSLDLLRRGLPHRPDGLANLKGVSLLRWDQVRNVLQECAAHAPRPDEREFADRAARWLAEKFQSES